MILGHTSYTHPSASIDSEEERLVIGVHRLSLGRAVNIVGMKTVALSGDDDGFGGGKVERAWI